MKNLIIAILASVIISGFGFWQYDIPSDRAWVAFTMALVLWVIIESLEDWLKYRRMMRFRSERFWRKILEEQKNRP